MPPSCCNATALLCFGCSNRIPQTGWLINNRHLFLMDLKAEKSKIKTPVGSGSWLTDDCLLAVSCIQKGEGALQSLFYKGANLIPQGSPS